MLARRLSRTLEVSAAPDHPFDPSTIPSSGSEKFTVPLSPETFHGHIIDPPEASVEVTKDQLVWMYSQMVKMRRCATLVPACRLA